MMNEFNSSKPAFEITVAGSLEWLVWIYGENLGNQNNRLRLVMTFSDAGHRSKIELTPEEMLEISQEISRKFAPNASSIKPESIDFDLPIDHGNLYARRQSAENEKIAPLHSRQDSHVGFSPKELYEISREISRQFAPDESTILPELFLLPVDPCHLYAYWDLGEKKEHITAHDDSGNGLTLRIYWRPDESPAITRSNVWFDVAVHDLEARQKVRLPIDDTAYSAALGKLDPDHNFDIYAISNIIRVPPGQMRGAPYRRQDDSAATNIKVAQPAQEKPNYAATELFDGETAIKSELSYILHEKGRDQFPGKGWFAKLHFGNPGTHGYGDAKNDTKLMDFLSEKGIAVQLIPEPVFFDAPHFQAKNASGQGI